MAITMLTNLINPEVMGDMISASLPNKIKFAPLATIDNTLVGVAGNTITVPQFSFIGEAEDLAEGIAMGTVMLTASSTTATVKKAAKAVEISDESALSGFGDPVGEANNQLIMSLASKIDSDCVTALDSATLVYDGSAGQISYAGIVLACDKFAEEDYEDKVLFITPAQLTTIRQDPNFLDINKYPIPVIMSGQVGSICGCTVVVSKKVTTDTTKTYNPIVKAGSLTIYMKRDIEVESARDILKKTTVISTDEHYVAVLSDASKVVKAIFLK